MQNLIEKDKEIKNIYKMFKPELTPKRMLEMGVFGGSYFGLNIKEFPSLWFKNVKISKTFDVNLNRFKIKAGLSRQHWIKKVGYLKKILWVGFNGIVDIQLEDVSSMLI